jgi:hypothetical protein
MTPMLRHIFTSDEPATKGWVARMILLGLVGYSVGSLIGRAIALALP